MLGITCREGITTYTTAMTVIFFGLPSLTMRIESVTDLVASGNKALAREAKVNMSKTFDVRAEKITEIYILDV